MSVQFKLDAFQGPLDLLLHLISKHKLNICDIEISLLLDQYLEYMNNLDEQDYESAGEFLEMAARLIYIKTVSLLPQPEEAQELKKDLEGQIIEYSICKKAAESLKSAYQGANIFVRKPVAVIINKSYTRVHEPDTLYNAYMGISAKSRNAKPLRADMFSPIVSKKIVSVTSKIIFVLKKLYRTGTYNMSDLYDGVTGRSERVATFLAVLELTKSGRIYINDDNTQIKFIRKEKTKNDNPETLASEQSEEISQLYADESFDIGVADEVEDVPVAEPIEEADDGLSTVQTSDYIKLDLEETDDNDNIPPKPLVKFSSERLYNERVISRPSENFVEQPEINHEISETVECDIELTVKPAESVDEIEEIEITTITEPPFTVFKPNYWNMRRYYWGYSVVGDDKRNNYWLYG